MCTLLRRDSCKCCFSSFSRHTRWVWIWFSCADILLRPLCCGVLSEAISQAHQLYGCKKAVVIFVVQVQHKTQAPLTALNTFLCPSTRCLASIAGGGGMSSLFCVCHPHI